MLFLAKRYPAQEAKEVGLINEVVPDDKLEKTTEEWLRPPSTPHGPGPPCAT